MSKRAADSKAPQKACDESENRSRFFCNTMVKAASRCEAAQAKGQGYAFEKACFEDTHVQSGTDLVGRRIPQCKRSPAPTLCVIQNS